MTLKKLLLGTSAAMFVGGAGITTAQAADPNPAGLVVTTMANYVEQCNNGNGWKKKDWCITVSGSIEWATTAGTRLSYGLNPWSSTVATVADSIFTINGIPTSYFGLSGSLTVTVSKPTDAGNLSFSFSPLSDSVGTLTIGPWAFSSTSVRYRNTFGPATVSVTIAEPGRLGWRDPRAPTSGSTSAYTASWSGPWPDAAIDVVFDAGAAEIEAGINVGQRTNDIGPGFPFVTVGGYLQGEFGAGPADMTVRFDWDRVNAADDGTGAPVFAYGIMAQADIDVGPVTLTPSVGWSHNYGYYGYKYQEHELGNYLMVGLDAEVALGDTLTLTTGVEFTRGPDHAFDAVLEVNGGIRFEPAGATPVYVALEGNYQRMLGARQLSAWNVALKVGAAF